MRQRNVVGRETTTDPGEGFVTRISSNIRPQDPGGGAARVASPPKLVKMDVMNSPDVSVVEPQSVPSRISVVLAEEVKVGGAQRVQRPCVDQDIWLLAGEAKPASVTVCDDSHLSTSVEGTLSSPDLAGKLFPVIPAGSIGPVGPCGMTSPSDLTSIGPVVAGSDPVCPVGPYISLGPVGSYGMSSPCAYDTPDTPGPLIPTLRGPLPQ